MNNLRNLSIFLLYISTISFFGQCGRETRSSHQNATPNIVLIISDDQGWTDHGFMGHEHIQTPNIDKLASQGLIFTRGYSAAPLCRPSLAAIATGLFPHQSGIIGNDPAFESGQRRSTKEWLLERYELDQKYVSTFRDQPTLMDILKEHKEYLSFQSGKWWEGHFSNGGFTHGMTHGDSDREGRHGDIGLAIGRQGLDTLYRFIDLALEKDKPFLVWYAPMMPHTPHNPPDSLKEKYLPLAPSPRSARYWAMCEWFDYTVGQLIRYIENKGLAENTLFVYVCDNGWGHNPDGSLIKRSKRSPYEMGIRSPIIFKWKGIIEPRMDTLNFVSSIDIAATVLSVCGISPTERMQGINVLDKDKLQNRPFIYSTAYAHDFVNVDSSLYYRMILTNPWKLILPDETNRQQQKPELYHLFKDPNEQHNKANEFPGIVLDLKKEIESWWKE